MAKLAESHFFKAIKAVTSLTVDLMADELRIPRDDWRCLELDMVSRLKHVHVQKHVETKRSFHYDRYLCYTVYTVIKPKEYFYFGGKPGQRFMITEALGFVK